MLPLQVVSHPSLPSLCSSHTGHHHRPLPCVDAVPTSSLRPQLKCHLIREAFSDSPTKSSPSSHSPSAHPTLCLGDTYHQPMLFMYAFIYYLPPLHKEWKHFESRRTCSLFCLYPLCIEQHLVPGLELLPWGDSVQVGKHINALHGRACLERRQQTANLGL